MVIALIADLHGNLPATEALERDLKRRNIDTIWCLGDMIGKGPSSAETMDWAMANCDVVLRGNWDEGIAARQFKNDRYYYDQLGDARMNALLQLPLEHRCVLSGRKIRLFHGRPVMQPLRFIQDDKSLLEPYFDPDFDAVCYADAHRQGLRLVGTGKQLINCGSVGNGLGVPMAQYAILTGEAGEEKAPFDVTLVTVPYDNARAAAHAQSADGLHNADAYINEVLTGVYSR